jgi:hypothetical protein
VRYLKDISPEYKEESVNYELFVRTIAMLLELRNLTDPDSSELNLQLDEQE